MLRLSLQSPALLKGSSRQPAQQRPHRPGGPARQNVGGPVHTQVHAAQAVLNGRLGVRGNTVEQLAFMDRASSVLSVRYVTVDIMECALRKLAPVKYATRGTRSGRGR